MRKLPLSLLILMGPSLKSRLSEELKLLCSAHSHQVCGALPLPTILWERLWT